MSDFAVACYNLGVAYRKQGQNNLADEHLYEAGFLAFIQSNAKVALKVYRSLEKMEAEKLAQELYELLTALLGAESNEK